VTASGPGFPAVAVVDTSVLVGAFSRRDDLHEAAVAALNAPRVLVLSPLVMAEVDYLLHTQAGEAVAVDALTRLNALAGQGIVSYAAVDRALYGEAEQLLRRYKGMRLGLADAVNAALAQRLAVPAILSFDAHYLSIGPRTERGPALRVHPGPVGAGGPAKARQGGEGRGRGQG